VPVCGLEVGGEEGIDVPDTSAHCHVGKGGTASAAVGVFCGILLETGVFVGPFHRHSEFGFGVVWSGDSHVGTMDVTET
jgi:hypothetical protein